MGNLKKRNAFPGLRFRNTSQGKSYFVEKMIDGELLSKTIGVVSYADAQKEYHQILANITQIVAETNCTISISTVNDAIGYYLDNYYNLKENASKGYCLFVALRDRIGNARISSLTIADIELYKQKRKNEKVQNADRFVSLRTIQAELGILSAALNYCVKAKLLTENPVKGLCNIKLPQKEIVVLDHGKAWGEQWVKIYEALGNTENRDARNQKALQMLFLTLYETGCRPFEVLSMERSWMELYDKSKQQYLIVIPEHVNKNGKSRMVPVSGKLRDELLSYCEKFKISKGLLFPSPVTGRVRYEGTINKPWDTAVASAMPDYTKRLTPYCLRRTRTTIWNQIDYMLCRYVVDHGTRDVHDIHYSYISPEMLFKLVAENPR